MQLGAFSRVWSTFSTVVNLTENQTIQCTKINLQVSHYLHVTVAQIPFITSPLGQAEPESFKTWTGYAYCPLTLLKLHSSRHCIQMLFQCFHSHLPLCFVLHCLYALLWLRSMVPRSSWNCVKWVWCNASPLQNGSVGWFLKSRNMASGTLGLLSTCPVRCIIFFWTVTDASATFVHL